VCFSQHLPFTDEAVAVRFKDPFRTMQ